MDAELYRKLRLRLGIAAERMYWRSGFAEMARLQQHWREWWYRKLRESGNEAIRGVSAGR